MSISEFQASRPAPGVPLDYEHSKRKRIPGTLPYRITQLNLISAEHEGKSLLVLLHKADHAGMLNRLGVNFPVVRRLSTTIIWCL
jgi:hypothetical protein